MVQTVKNLPAMQETWVWSLGQEDPLEKGMATHTPGILAWIIPMDRGYNPWSHRESDTTELLTLHFLMSPFLYSHKGLIM